MKKLTFISYSLTLLLSCSLLSFAKRMPETIIRVGLIQKQRSFNISCEGEYYLYEIKSGAKTKISPLNDYLLRGSKNIIKFDGKIVSSPAKLICEDKNSFIRINGRRYRDNIFIICKDGLLTVINELGIEHYVSGVLSKEVDPEWGIESLKAQAVISRTYALRNIGKHGAENFDMCNNTHCQVYGGMESETGKTNKAVEATKNEVLVYKGELAQSFFHASCGGHTENCNNVWDIRNNIETRYLSGRPDRFCSDSPHNFWESKISSDFIEERLSKAGYKVGKISNIRISGKSGSGRAKMLNISHSGGTLSILAAKFRLAVDPWLIKSVMFKRISKNGKYFEFSGKGWGHGVGMCQWGAKQMADRGYNYKQILKHYYPGTKAEKWEE